MKFIFPKNYKINTQLFGYINYPTVIVNLIWYAFVFCLLNLVFINISIKIFLFIALCFPLFLFSFIGFHNENIVYVIWYLLKFIKNSNIYFYK